MEESYRLHQSTPPAWFYKVLEYMGGGDLLNLLIERDVFEEDFTRFYVAEVSDYRPFNCFGPWIPTFPALDGARH